MAKQIVIAKGYKFDKQWKEGDTFESDDPSGFATWYHPEGGKPRVAANMDAATAIMNKPVTVQDIDTLKADLAKSQQKDREIADLKAQLAAKEAGPMNRPFTAGPGNAPTAEQQHAKDDEAARQKAEADKHAKEEAERRNKQSDKK